MIATGYRALHSSGASRASVAHELAQSPRFEWDSLSRCMIPTLLTSDREPREFLRGDIMMGGPWSHRGDLHELRASDLHERMRVSALALLGFYDHEKPDFDAPAYRKRIDQVHKLYLLAGASGTATAASMLSNPKRQTWLFTGVPRYYDAAFLVTLSGSNATGLGNGGTDGATYDATNGSGTLTITSAWKGSLSALTGTAGANDWLGCGGTAANWRIHGGNLWTIVVCGDVTDGSASRTLVANRNSTGTGPLGAGLYHVTGSGIRWREGNGAATVYSSGMGAGAEPGTAPFVYYTRFNASQTTGRAIRSPALTIGSTVAQSNAPSNTDASALGICGGSAGNAPNYGHVAIVTLNPVDSGAYGHATMDQMRALSRI